MEAVRITFVILLVLCAGCDSGAASSENGAPEEAQYSFSNNPQVALAECVKTQQGSDEQEIAAFVKHAETQIGILKKIDPAVNAVSAAGGSAPTTSVSIPLETCVNQLRERQKILNKQQR